MRHLGSTGALAALAMLAALTTTATLTATPRDAAVARVARLAADPAVAAKARGGLLMWFSPRPTVDGSGGVLPARDRAPVWLRLSEPPTGSDLATLELVGVRLDRHPDATPWIVGGTILHGHLAAADLPKVAALPRVRSIELDGLVLGAPPPLDLTAAEIQATDVWRSQAPDGGPLTGRGVTVCDADRGIDVFHPAFFRADAGYHDWLDVDGDGLFAPNIDAVDLGAAGIVTLRVLDGVVTSAWEDIPLYGSDDPGYALGLDWLYADVNGSGDRNFGPGEGYDSTSPGFGEPLFVSDDVNGNGKLDPGEKIVMLGTSKVAAARFNGDVYRRGENLIDTPRGEETAHAVASSGVMVSGQPGLSTKVGIAPGADLLMVWDDDWSDPGGLVQWCMDEGARVVLHEYALWYGDYLDGSSPMEQLIDDSSVSPGVAHINPAGNLSTAQKLYKRMHPAGATTTIVAAAAADSPYAPFSFIAMTLLWRDPTRKLSVVLEDPTGFSMQLPVNASADYGAWNDGLYVYSERDDSDRGTARLDVWVFDPNYAQTIPHGDWLAHVTDPADPSEAALEVIAYVADDTSGWGMGIHFPDHSSEDHLIGWPGTADHGIAVAAYTGTGYNSGTPGERAYYSGRGYRIDGEEILSLSAPADPIVPAYREGAEARYYIYGGTSGASPHVAGAAALLFQQDPSLDGVAARQALRDGALADGQVGAAPNRDWGYGKLRVYRTLYGTDPPGGGAPSILPIDATLAAGETATFEVVVTDPDDPPSSLVVDIDRDYDGSFDETLPLDGFSASFDSVGVYWSKLRVTDPSGRSAAALARFEVTVAPDPKPNLMPYGLLSRSGEGCGCALPGSSRQQPPHALGLLALSVLALGRARRQLSRARRS